LRRQHPRDRRGPVVEAPEFLTRAAQDPWLAHRWRNLAIKRRTAKAIRNTEGA